MYLPDPLADVMLAFSHTTVLLLFTFLGGLLYGRRALFNLLAIACLDIIVNVSLKGTFKVPLSPSVGKIGYAYPSGHMMLATCYYMYWAFELRKRIWVCLAIGLLVGIGSSLIHYGYHDLFDVVGGFVFGLLLVQGFSWLQSKANATFVASLLGLSSLLVLYCLYVYSSPPSHMWIAYSLLLSSCIVAFVWAYLSPPRARKA